MTENITIKQEPVDHYFGVISQPDQNIDVNQEKITLPVEVKNELVQGAQYPVYIVPNANFKKQSCDFNPQQTYTKEITMQPLIIYKNDPENVENTAAGKLERFGNDLQIMPPSNSFSGQIENFEQQKSNKSHHPSMNMTWVNKGQNLKKETVAAQKDPPSTQNFQCSICWKQFDSEKALKTHFLTHIPCIPKQIKLVTPPTQRKPLENGKKKNYSTSIDCGQVFNRNNEQKKHQYVLPFACELCGLKYELKHALKKHMESVHQVSDHDYHCLICSASFYCESHLKDHMKMHNKDKLEKNGEKHLTEAELLFEHVCSICGVNYKTEHYLKKHMESTHQTLDMEINNYKCLICAASFYCNDHLIDHQKIHKDDNLENCDCNHLVDLPFVCKICSASYKLKHNFKKHMEVEHQTVDKDSNDYNCLICPASFYCESYLKDHQKVHKYDKPLTCYKCGECFTTRQAFISHANSHVENKTKKCHEFPCNICPKIFSQLSRLNKHMKSHSNDRKFPCDICSKIFYRRGQLNRHMKSHSFPCNICPKIFSQPSGLNKHMKSHSNERKFLCNICSKTFYQLGQLNKHMMSHSDERKFPCDICGKKFKQKEHLRWHFEVHFRQKEQAKAHYMYYNKLQLEEIERALGNLNKTEFSCADCDLVFETATELKAHSDKAKKNVDIICEPILTDLENKELSCKICFKVFDSRGDFQQHYHRGMQECEICLLKFGKPYQLQDHTRTHVKLTEDMYYVKKFIEEGREKNVFVCCACQEKFPDRVFMDLHILLKNGEGSHKKHELMSRFQCDICFAVFKSNSGLLNHQRVHQAKTYLCDECGKEFSLLSDFTQHKLYLHVQSQQEKKKKVQCYVCNLEFDKPCELKVHIIESIGDGVHKRSNTHATRGQKWECSFCDVVCPNKTGLTLHMQRKHLEKGTQMDNSISLLPTSNSQNQKPNVEMDIELSQPYSDNSNCSTILSSNSSSNTQDNVTNLNGSPELCCEIIDIEESQSYPYSEELASLTAQRSITVENSNYSANLPPQLQDILEENQKSTSKPTQNLNKISEGNKVYTDKGLRFKCHFCPKLSINFENLKKHMRVHSMHSEKLYCGKCGKSFNNKNGLKEHTENQYQCTKCPQRFCRAIDFKKHHRQHQLENKLQCPHCPKWFISEVHYKYHVGSHTGEKMFKCTLCQRAFKDTYGLTVHMRRHKKEKQYMCHNCGKCFIDLGSLRMHNKIHNEKKEIHKCDQCDKQYAHKESLKYHVRKQHQNERLKCNLCNKTFIHTANLRIHEKQHTGIKPFECDVCGKKFYTKFLLQTHANIHSRVKKFTCDICGKKFAQSAALYTHKKNLHRKK